MNITKLQENQLTGKILFIHNKININTTNYYCELSL
jgi:hypothetical protein